ncbi:MAG: glycosyltransferase family 9 protein [Candidatus Omnitrophota bacterium]|nr:glycosyltransferase family 9 protein [Candidatus Omnitrophota bacterium]
MKIALIRRIDKFIGVPLCALLTIHRILFTKATQYARHANKTQKIIFIKLSEQGSTVISIPALQRASKLVGAGNVYFLVFTQNRPILDMLGIILPENIIEIDACRPIRMFFSFLRALCRIRKEKIDTCLDMEFYSRGSAIIAYLSGARARVGLHAAPGCGPWRGDLLTHRLAYDPTLHTELFFVRLVETASHGADQHARARPHPQSLAALPQFTPRLQEKDSLTNIIMQRTRAPVTFPIIIINPNTADPLRVRAWPKENFIELGKKIMRDIPSATIVVSGTYDEQRSTGEIAAAIPGACSLAGKTSLRELLTLYCIADVLVTSDSGPGHFAALTPINAVILFGPETPLLYGPRSPNTTILYHAQECSPCLSAYNQRQSTCKQARCLESISVNEVYRNITSALKRRGGQ